MLQSSPSAAPLACAFRLVLRAVLGAAISVMGCAGWSLVTLGHGLAAEPNATRVERRMAAYTTLLKRSGVDPTAEGAIKFLESYLEPQGGGSAPGERAAAARNWLEQLNAPDFGARQQAQLALTSAPWAPATWLRERIDGDAPEAAWRAQAVRDAAGFRHDQILRAAVTLAASDPSNASRLARTLDSLLGPADDPTLVRFVRDTAARRERRFDDANSVYDRATLDGMLVATGTRGLVLELSAEGRERWRVPLAAWSAERRSNGRTLLASLDARRVVEVEHDGRVVWEQRGVSAIRAKPLADGSYLVVDHSGRRVVQWNQAGVIVWRHEVSEPCLDAERLANGHTLIATANQVSEVTPTGETVWQWNVQGRINGLQSLAEGRLLIANFGAGEVVELDEAGRVLRKFEEPQPSDAFRTADGATLVTSAARVVEFGADGVLRRVVTTARYGSARR